MDSATRLVPGLASMKANTAVCSSGAGVALVLPRDNGQDALEYLLRTRDATGPPSPELILLDLNLPGLSGLDILERIKVDTALRQIPVVVMTSSSAPLLRTGLVGQSPSQGCNVASNSSQAPSQIAICP
ncbi:MAG: response regulator [Euzebya sp.]